jgi:hypothetical protein
MIRHSVVLFAAAFLTVLACDRPASDAEQQEFAARALKGVLTYPQSTVTSVSAGNEAAEVTLTTAAPPDAVADWYRQALVANGWEIKSDTRQPTGAVVIRAVKEASPLWVTLRPSMGGRGTTYTLIGVVLEGDSIH